MAIGTGLLLGLAGLSGVGNVISSIIGANAARDAQDSANQANKELTREQMEYQTSERIASQEYNTPAMQRLRYEEAGINPYMALGNVNSGNTQAQTGVDVPEMKAAPDNALSAGLKSASSAPMDAINMIQQVQANQEAVQGAKIQNMFRIRKEILELNNMQSDINKKLTEMDKNSAEAEELRSQMKLNQQNIEMLTKQMQYADDYFSSRNSKERNMADLAYQQQMGQWFDNRAKSIHLQYAARIDAATLKKINAEAAKAWQEAATSGKLSELYDVTKTNAFLDGILNRAGIRLDNEHKNVVNHYLGEQIRLGMDLKRMQLKSAEQDYYNPFYYSRGALGAVAGAALGTLVAPGLGTAAGAAVGAGMGSSRGYGFTNMPTQGQGSMW